MEADADKIQTEEPLINKEPVKVVETDDNNENSQTKQKESEERNGELMISSSSSEEGAEKVVEQDPLAVERAEVEVKEKNNQEDHNRSLNIIDERLYPKDEDDDSASNSPLSNVMVIVNDHDPMDLLMPLNRGNQRTEGDSDEDSGSGNAERMPKEELWKLWMTKYEWLLHEPSQGDFAYCLYCDVTVHIGSIKYIKQHGISLYHQEREDNYLAFKASEEQLRGKTTIMEIKQEFETDSRVAALKYQRIAQADPLNNFNWTRWMKTHPWLVREHDEGTIGYCKYCKTRLNIEFTYLRKRHETSKGHREAEHVYNKRESRKSAKKLSEQSRKRKRRDDEDDDDDDDGDDDGDGDDDDDEDEEDDEDAKGQEADEDDDQDDEESDGDETLFLQTIPNTTPALANCKLCEVKLIKSNFRRHTRTKCHIQNLRAYKSKNKTIKKEAANMSFSKYAKKHPWLTSDPSDPDCGYCTVCDKRFKYGHSEARRKVHENSAPHKTAAGLPVNEDNDQASDGHANEESDSEETANQESDKMSDCDDNASSNLQEDEQMDEEEKSAKPTTGRRVMRGSKQWFANKDYPWCKPHRNDPNYMTCIYCNISLTLAAKRKIHSETQRHRAAELEWRKKHKNTKKPAYYPWLCYTRNKKIQFCKYCRVRFPNEQSKARHEHSQRHKDSLKKYSQKNKQRVSQNRESEERASNASSVVEPGPSNSQGDAYVMPQREKAIKNNIHATVSQWKPRFPWLSYKRNEQRQNYGWCKLCEASFFVPSYKYASKHQRSGRHIRARFELKRSEEGKESMSQTSVTAVEKSQESLADLQEKYPWLDPDEDEKYCRCRVCDVRLPMKLLYRRQHNTSKRHLEQVRLQAERTASTTAVHVVNATDKDTIQVDDEEEENDVSIVEDNASDDVLTIKSESAADAVERFIESTQNESLSETNEPQAKRPKLSAGVLRNPAVDARQRMLQTVRQLSSKHRYENSPLALAEGILSSSLSIAACFAPLMQQSQNQNQTETTTGGQTTPKANSTVNQSFDDISTTAQSKRDITNLFFESVSETMKSLPSDLVAEGKMKIMQVMYDLEVRAMQRRSGKSVTTGNNQADIVTNGHATVPSNVNGNGVTSTPTANVSETLPLSNQSSTIVNEGNDDITTNNAEDDIIFVSTQSPTATAVAEGDGSNNIKKNQTMQPTAPQSAQVRPMYIANGNTTIVTNKTNDSGAVTATNRVNDTTIRRLPMPATLQINNRVEAGTVRCVPLNTLTGFTKGTDQILGTKHSTPIQRNPPTNVQVSDHNVTTNSVTPTMSNSSNSGVRQIRVNTSTQSKFITIKTGGTTEAPIRMKNSASSAPQMRLNNNPMQIRHVSK